MLEFTSEYGISEALHPELPGPEDRIVDFPEGKQEAREKYHSMLYQALRFPKKLKQPLLLGGREGVPDYCGLAHKCSEGRDAIREYALTAALPAALTILMKNSSIIRLKHCSNKELNPNSGNFHLFTFTVFRSRWQMIAVAGILDGGVLLLENVRFYKKEEKNDPAYPKKLVSLADLIPHAEGRDTVQLETAETTISQEYLLEFTSEYGISKALHPELPGPEDRIVDFPKRKARPRVDVFQQEAREKYHSMLYQALRFPKNLEQLLLLGGREDVPDYCGLAHKCSEGRDAIREYVFPRDCDDTEHTSHSNPETTRSTTLLGRIELHILPGRRDMDLFSLICSPNPTKVKTGIRPRVAHEVPMLTVTANRVIEMEDPAAATDSSGVPSTIESGPEVPPLENVTTTGVAPEAGQVEGVASTSPHVVKERRKRGYDRVDTNLPPKVMRRDHADPQPTESTRGGKSLAAIELGMGSTRPVPASQGAPVDVSDPDPLSFADPQSPPSADVTQSFVGVAAARDPESENTSFTSMAGSPESIYRPEWGITNGCLLDALEACQDLVDHIAPPGYFLELRHMHNDDFLKKYNVNLARQVAMGSQLRLRENEIKNLETLLEAETDIKKAAKNKSAKLSKESENMRALFLDFQVSNNHLSQRVSTLQKQVMGEEKLKSAFEEFKQYEDNPVEQHCAEINARLEALSIDFDEELYPHMLIAIAGRRWGIERGLRLAVMKYGESTELRQAFANVVSVGIAKGMSEGLKHRVEHGKAKLDLEAIEAYDPEAKAKYIAALHAFKNLKYPLVDQLESLKDAPIDVIMASLHLKSDTGDDASQWIRELHPSSSQLTIPVYLEARDPMDPWACKEKILLADAIAANVSRDEKKKNAVWYAVRIAILLGDAAAQTKISEDEASPRLLRSSSLPVMHS
nr:phosphoglycerate kinase [Tanacetum cinerariifolium]